MRSKPTLLIGLAISVFVLAGCTNGSGTASQETQRKIWANGRIDVPTSMIKPSGCRSGLIRNLDKNCSESPVPVVVFMHGCTGFNNRQFAHSELFKRLGYPVVSPSSFARPNRIAACDGSDWVIDWRLEEIEIALNELEKLPWVDKNNLVLAGFSEGGLAVAAYGGRKFRAIIGMGFGCDRTHFFAPNDVAVLHINGRNDSEVRYTALCSGRGREKFEAYYVNTGHPVNGDPNTLKYIDKFLGETVRPMSP